LQEWKVKALARTYLKATQGVPLIMNFNHETGQFFAKIDINHDIKAPTVIYTNDMYWYPDGFDYIIADTFRDRKLGPKQVKIDTSDPLNFQF
jgi:hypothetical protein